MEKSKDADRRARRAEERADQAVVRITAAKQRAGRSQERADRAEAKALASAEEIEKMRGNSLE